MAVDLPAVQSPNYVARSLLNPKLVHSYAVALPRAATLLSPEHSHAVLPKVHSHAVLLTVLGPQLAADLATMLFVRWLCSRPLA